MKKFMLTSIVMMLTIISISFSKDVSEVLKAQVIQFENEMQSINKHVYFLQNLKNKDVAETSIPVQPEDKSMSLAASVEKDRQILRKWGGKVGDHSCNLEKEMWYTDQNTKKEVELLMKQGDQITNKEMLKKYLKIKQRAVAVLDNYKTVLNWMIKVKKNDIPHPGDPD